MLGVRGIVTSADLAAVSDKVQNMGEGQP